MTVKQREKSLAEMHNNESTNVCLISVRAGGLGLDLTCANHCLFAGIDYNPAVDDQAEDRCHRLSQKKEVHICRFIAEDTIDRNILMKQNYKRELGRTISTKKGENHKSIQRVETRDDGRAYNCFDDGTSEEIGTSLTTYQKTPNYLPETKSNRINADSLIDLIRGTSNEEKANP